MRMPRRAWEADFHYAARTGDLPTVLSALREGLPPDKRDQRGRTALTLAAQYGHLEVVRALLAQGADVDCQVKWHFTPLVLAVSRRHSEVALLLIEHGANVNQVVALEERSVFTLAVLYRQGSVVEAMLRRGADPHHQDARGRTALSYAREIKDADLTRLLLQGGAAQ